MTARVPLTLAPVSIEGPANSPWQRQLWGVVLLAALSATPIIRGKLQLLDVICIAILPLLAGWILRDRRLLLLCCALALWGVGQANSDEVNELGFRLSLQLAAAVTMLGLVPALIWLSRGDLRRMYVVQVGLALGAVSEWVIVQHVPITSPAAWKYALNVPLSIGLLALTSLTWQSGRRWPSLVALLGIAGLGAATDTRHLAAVAVVTALLVIVPRRPEKHPRVWSTLAGLVIMVGGLSGLFLQSADAGYVGERTSGQVAAFGTNPATFLVNVRPEMFQELYLYSRHPIVGWGSIPQMDSATFAGSLEFLREIGVRRTDVAANWKDLEVPGVAAHSTSVDSFVRGGAAAVPFWVLALVLALRAGTLAVAGRTSPLVVFWTMLIVWNTFFEPMTAHYHLELGAYLALALTAIRTWDGGDQPPDLDSTSASR